MSDPEDDELDFEEFMELSEAEQDRELYAAWRQHDEWWATLTPAQQFTFRRRRRLDICLRWRRSIKQWDIPIFRQKLRENQVALLRLRSERALGTKAGEA